MVKIKSMEIETNFNPKENKFYELHKEILHNMLEKIAIGSSKRTMINFKRIFPKFMYRKIMKKYDEELEKLK